MLPGNNLGGKPWLDNRAGDEMLPRVPGPCASLSMKPGLVAAAGTNNTIKLSYKQKVLSHITKWEPKFQIKYLQWKKKISAYDIVDQKLGNTVFARVISIPTYFAHPNF